MGTGSEAANVLLVLESLAEALRQQGYAPPSDGVTAAEKVLAVTGSR
jgi:hypothetical protein